jgi:hypothetical protein
MMDNIEIGATRGGEGTYDSTIDNALGGFEGYLGAMPYDLFASTDFIETFGVSSCREGRRLVVLNSASSESNGEHWIALFRHEGMPSNCVKVFDPLGTIAIEAIPTQIKNGALTGKLMDTLESINLVIVDASKAYQLSSGDSCGKMVILFAQFLFSRQVINPGAAIFREFELERALRPALSDSEASINETSLALWNKTHGSTIPNREAAGAS